MAKGMGKAGAKAPPGKGDGKGAAATGENVPVLLSCQLIFCPVNQKMLLYKIIYNSKGLLSKKNLSSRLDKIVYGSKYIEDVIDIILLKKCSDLSGSMSRQVIHEQAESLLLVLPHKLLHVADEIRGAHWLS